MKTTYQKPICGELYLTRTVDDAIVHEKTGIQLSRFFIQDSLGIEKTYPEKPTPLLLLEIRDVQLEPRTTLQEYTFNFGKGRAWRKAVKTYVFLYNEEVVCTCNMTPYEFHLLFERVI